MLKVQQIELSKLKPWHDNPRINDEAAKAVAKSIESFGFNVPILCDRDFNIIAGHTRWKSAKKIGLKSVPIIVLEMSENQCKAFAIADNKTGEISEWNFPKLQKVLKKLKNSKFELSALGYCQAELQMILTKQRNFNWKTFEEQFKTELTQTHVLLPVKIPAKMKEALKEAISRFADKNNIEQKDFAKMAGQVFGLLLGVSQ